MRTDRTSREGNRDSSVGEVPRITIVTPSYNQGDYLEEAILSVLDQGYPNLEYIVLDGGSTDSSRHIIEKYAPRLHFSRSAPDQGQAAALREGFEMATGVILAWLNSDDMLAPGALSRVAEAWMTHGTGLVIAGGCQVFGTATELPPHFPRFQEAFDTRQPLPTECMLDMAKHWFPGEFFYQPEVFFPRDLYLEVGGVDPTIYYTMDYDLWMRFALAGTEIVVVPQVLACYREHSGQKTANLNALHRQMVETANRYLQDDRVAMNQLHKRAIAVSNRLALNPISSTGALMMRRLVGV